MPGEEVRIADARDRDALRRAFEGASVVASLAGPFLELGLGPVQEAVAVGAHYLDTSGEQQWAGLVHAEIRAPTVVLPSFGFDYVPGDLAARLAAEKVDGPLDELVVAYSVKGVRTSRGTRRSIGDLMGQSQVAWQDGGLVPSRFGATTRRVRFPFGERTVVEWGGTEPITVPRHTDVRNVRSYIRAPGIAAKVGGLGRLAAPFVRAASRVGPSGPSEASRAEEPLHRRRGSARPCGERTRRSRGHGRLWVDRTPDRSRRSGATRRRGARHRRACAGRGVRRSHLRGPTRAVPADRRVMSSGSPLTVRSNATAPNAERGRMLRPLLRVAGRGRREGHQRRPPAIPVRDTRLRRVAPLAL